MAYKLDFDSLTIGEVEEFGAKWGVDQKEVFRRLGESNLRVAAWYWKQQEEPGFTWEQAGRLTMKQIHDIEVAIEAAEVEPKGPNAGGATSHPDSTDAT